MDAEDAHDLIASAIEPSRGAWADLGAGTGTFTIALARVLQPESTVYAFDTDGNAFAPLRASIPRDAARIITVRADFSDTFSMPSLGDSQLDGILFANSLHFVEEVDVLLRRLVERVRLGGQVILIEYDRRAASRWVPYPIPAARWSELARTAGLAPPVVTARRPSAYIGQLYAAVSRRI